MAERVAVILVVGLTRSLLDQRCPNLAAFARSGTVRNLSPVLPAVTCPVQASMLTGLSPGEREGRPGHGVVANGWYSRDLAEIQFWKQSRRLMAGETVWEAARRRDPGVTCAQLFWWFNMYCGADYSVTPRPIYRADGRKVPDIYTNPAGLRERLQGELGRFPLFHFWGPAASIRSSQWIADAARIVESTYKPNLNLIYLPHLDYTMQAHGPDGPEADRALTEMDGTLGPLLNDLNERGVGVMIVSEYGIEPVSRAVAVNRALREEGLLAVRDELGTEVLDPGASGAFAVADHQVAHVYVQQAGMLGRCRRVVENMPGVELVLDHDALVGAGLSHPRSGELVLVAEPGCWFTYDYWLDDRRAPDFARIVDIHRKPGYDPRELFIDPAIRFPRAAIAWRVLKQRMSVRTLMDLIPLDAGLVRGSHGRVALDTARQPVMITQREYEEHPETLPCQSVKRVILEHLFAGPWQGEL